jgi:hypothetical protein
MRRGARMRLAVAACACALLFQGCAMDATHDACAPAADVHAQALHAGSPDAGALSDARADRLPIGAILLAREDAAILCTATVIAPGLGLTAAHCAQAGPIAFRLDDGLSSVTVTGATPHPTLDVMLFRFDAADLPPLSPVPLFDGTIDRGWEGRQLMLAGVGLTETGARGELRFVREPLVAVTPTELHVDGMGQSGACSGDSGGPLLVHDDLGTARIAGVLDRGDPSCRGLDVYTRIDAFRSWLRELAPALARATGECR